MRFMMIVKADANSEAGARPGEELLAAMGRYNEELMKAGVLLAGEGLHPTSRGARVRFRAQERTVVEGPFPCGDLIAGFWLIQAKSREEAIEWARRCPNPAPDSEGEIEIRQVFSPDDFGLEFTPELQAAEERLREQLAARA